MARIAGRWVVVALVAASLLIGVTIVITRWRLQQTTQTLQVPIDNVALPLDRNGAGTQIVSDTVLSVALAPFPPRAGVASQLLLTASDWRTKIPRNVQPMLEVVFGNQVNGAKHAMERASAGSYVANGVFFPSAGQWRVRVTLDLGDGLPYTMLIVADAK